MGDLGWCFMFKALFLHSDCATAAEQDSTNHRNIWFCRAGGQSQRWRFGLHLEFQPAAWHSVLSGIRCTLLNSLHWRLLQKCWLSPAGTREKASITLPEHCSHFLPLHEPFRAPQWHHPTTPKQHQVWGKRLVGQPFLLVYSSWKDGTSAASFTTFSFWPPCALCGYMFLSVRWNFLPWCDTEIFSFFILSSAEQNSDSSNWV